jgi:polyphosphate kinase
MTGYAEPSHMDAIGFSPLTTRDTLLEQIDREIECAKAGKPATIWLKMNSLVDKMLIDALYRGWSATWTGAWRRWCRSTTPPFMRRC